MSQVPDPTETAALSLNAGVALALKAHDSGDWKAVVDWITQHPDHAAGLAGFLAAQGGLQSAIRPAGVIPDRTGITIGEFVLREEIGRGAMGVVHRAYDPVLKRDVAMKLIRTGVAISEDKNLARFRFEAETVANLDHPHIVRVFASGETDGIPYLVMPLMEGGSLANKLKLDGVYRPRAAAELIRDVARGVHHAHQQGLIHRDLKPGNILLDSEERPHVADFGLARSLETTATVSGGFAGTPAYMAPEQARGDKRLTVAVDVHALGAVLYELLIGRPPFGTDEVHRTLKRILEEPAPSIRDLRPDVPADLEAICRKCLEKEPGDRYSSAEALAEDLTRYLEGEALAGHSRRGIFTSVQRAFVRRRETLEMATWATPLWGAASSLLALLGLQVAILCDAPSWIPAAALVYYLSAWFGIVWYFLVTRRHDMNPVESGSMATQFGMIVAASLVTLPYWLLGANIASVFQALAAVVGLGVYVHGAAYWGRLYLAGFLIMSTAAIMPWIPQQLWPGLFGLAVCAFQVWVGFHLMAVHRQSRNSAK